MNLAPGNYNFDIYPGTAITDSFVFEDEDGTLVDLTGCHAALVFKYKGAPVTPVLTFITDNGKLTIDAVTPCDGAPVNAGISCVTDDSIAVGLAPGRLFQTLIITPPNQPSFVVLTGSSTIHQV
jgi:hypothetical protein